MLYIYTYYITIITVILSYYYYHIFALSYIYIHAYQDVCIQYILLYIHITIYIYMLLYIYTYYLIYNYHYHYLYYQCYYVYIIIYIPYDICILYIYIKYINISWNCWRAGAYTLPKIMQWKHGFAVIRLQTCCSPSRDDSRWGRLGQINALQAVLSTSDPVVKEVSSVVAFDAPESSIPLSIQIPLQSNWFL
jgi:hypothetical protein